MANNYTKKPGFSILEVVAAIALFAIIILLTGSMFSMAQRSYTKGANESELSQNIRVALDRMSREIRQSQNIITTLPTIDNDPENPPANELFFQDGHDTDSITYLRYYLNGTNLMRVHEAYYLPGDPETYVPYNSRDQDNNTTTKMILEESDNIIGEYFEDLKLWGTKKLIHITMDLKKGTRTSEVTTSVFSRNY